MDEKTPKILTIYGSFVRGAKKRLDLTYDYEHAAINGLKLASESLEVSRFFDVGANIGVYSIYMSSVPTIKNVHSFEPSPEAFFVLSESIEIQPNAEIFDCRKVALSSSSGLVHFASFGGMAGNNGIVNSLQSSKTPKEVIDVNTVRLDDLIQVSGETFSAKIDVEGHEIDVITGAETYLKRNRGILQIESFAANAARLRNVMISLGYQQIFRMKDDYYFTNIEDDRQRERIVDTLFDENAKALQEAQELKILRRRLIREIRVVFDSVRYGSDPIIR